MVYFKALFTIPIIPYLAKSPIKPLLNKPPFCLSSIQLFPFSTNLTIIHNDYYISNFQDRKPMGYYQYSSIFESIFYFWDYLIFSFKI